MVDLFTAIDILSSHKHAILNDNGWVHDDYDDMYKHNSGRMLSSERMNKIIDKYLTNLRECEMMEIDIFKVIHVLLTELSKVW